LVAVILGIVMLAYLLAVSIGEQYAKGLNHTWAGPGLGGTYCSPAKIHPVLSAPQSLEQDASSVVTLVVDVDPISEEESNPADPCLLKIDLLAPKFAVTPTPITLTVPVSRGGQYVGRWLFAPVDVGTYDLAFTVNTCFGVIGVSVLNPLGLPAKLAYLLVFFSSAIVAWVTNTPSLFKRLLKPLSPPPTSLPHEAT
jgi:hypothetical protein